MPSLYEVDSVGSAISFLVWTLVVIALTKAIFGSFLAAEIGWWLNQRNAKQHEQIRRLQWEVQHGAKYDLDVVRRSPHAVRQPLSAAELARKRAELEALSRGTLLMRAARYLAECFACQTFWIAVLCYGATTGIRNPGLCLLTAAACSSAAAIIISAGRCSPRVSRTEERMGRDFAVAWMRQESKRPIGRRDFLRRPDVERSQDQRRNSRQVV